MPRYDLQCLFAEGYSSLGKSVNILDEKWTNEDKMMLNGSQLAAVKSALTNQLSVIQGGVPNLLDNFGPFC